ncbi:MAG: S9 family peptidase [Anaerolineaceae bacterium]
MENQCLKIENVITKNDIQRFQFGMDDSILWVENEGGVGKAFIQNEKEKSKTLELDNPIKSGIFYGGGEFCTAKEKAVFCVNRNQLVIFNLKTGESKPIIPTWGKVAAPSISPDGKWVLYVFSDGETDLIGVAPTHGLDWPRQIVKGADFYLQPTWHPQGELIAWVEWDHPCMPWQGSRIKIGEVGGMQIRLSDETWVDGKIGRAAHQPLFSPNGRWLSYLLQNGEWEDLILYDLKKKEKKVLVHGEDFMLSTPDWVQGLHSYDWGIDAKSIFYIRYKHAQATLWKVNIRSSKSVQIPTAPFSWLSQLNTSPQSGTLAFLASSPLDPKQIVVIKEGKLEFVCPSQEKAEIDYSKFANKPEQIEWKGQDDESVFGILYLPKTEQKMYLPLLVDVHGGPTMQRTLSESTEAFLYTSRGYAFLQVNYRGSSGYGLHYQDKLKGMWGVLEVDDIYTGVKHLIETGIAHPDKIALIGSSSGGTTVLNTLRKYPGIFRCAICSFGIGDLILDAKQTHKFERFYHQYLIGDLEKKIEAFQQRSPLFHIDEIRDPLLLFHGSEDPVVHPSQSQALYDSLVKRGIPCTLKIFEKEGHGFKREETLREYYELILQFLALYL